VSSLSWPQTSLNDHQDLVQFSTIKSPWRRWQYKLSEAHHNLGGSQRKPSLSRGWIPKNNERTEIVGKMLLLEDRKGHSRIGSNLSYKACIWLKLERDRGREFDLQKLRSKGFSSQQSGGGTPFIAPTWNLPVGVLEIQTCPARSSDISEKVTGIRSGHRTSLMLHGLARK
jgi:hypothetical protein